MSTHPVIWKAHTIHVDLDTEEQITQHRAETEYYHIKTKKHAKYTNKQQTHGTIEYTKQYRRKPKQGILEFNYV